MLGFLFRGLTADRQDGARLFDALVAEARRPHYYVEGQVPDTLDGRFALLSTVTAITLVRLERDGKGGDPLSVALTERFIQVMESEHRELGLGDPTLGKTVRKLVAMLAKRTELWRDSQDVLETTRASLYRDAVDTSALEQSATALDRFRSRIAGLSLADLEQGRMQ